jgi:hypothetical protein
MHADRSPLFEIPARDRSALDVVRGALIAMPDNIVREGCGLDLMRAVHAAEHASRGLAPYRDALAGQFGDDALAILDEVRLLTLALREADIEASASRDAWGAPTVDLRVRALARLARTYDQLRRMTIYLRWEQGDADLLAPPLASLGVRAAEVPCHSR